MTKRGFVGYVAMITGSIDAAGYMTGSQLRSLASAGWEVGSHTHNNVVATSVTPAQFGVEMDTSIAALVDAGLPRPRCFTYVAGARNADTDKEVYRRFTKCFSTVSSFATPDPSRPTFMLPYGVSIGTDTATDDLEAVKRHIEGRLARGQNAIFYCHDITDGTPVGAQMTRSAFVALLDWVATRNYPVILPTSTPPHNLIYDGSFEQYDFTGNTSYGVGYTLIGPWYGSLAASKYARVTADRHTGSYAIEFDSSRNGAAAFDVIRQAFPVVPGVQYRIRYWERVTAMSAGDVRGGIAPFDCFGVALTTTTLTITNAPTGGWVERSSVWTAPAGAEYATFRWSNSTATGVAYLDDVAIYPTSAYDFLAG